jgi:hypothetical protein
MMNCAAARVGLGAPSAAVASKVSARSAGRPKMTRAEDVDAMPPRRPAARVTRSMPVLLNPL